MHLADVHVRLERRREAAGLRVVRTLGKRPLKYHAEVAAVAFKHRFRDRAARRSSVTTRAVGRAPILIRGEHRHHVEVALVRGHDELEVEEPPLEAVAAKLRRAVIVVLDRRGRCGDGLIDRLQ